MANQRKKDDQSDSDQRQERAKAPPMAGPAFAAAEGQVKDLSRDIVEAVPRAPGEQVRCRRISGNHYRCNWWGPQGTGTYDNPNVGGLLVTTHRVLRSQLLRVTRTESGLVIEPGEKQ